MCFENLTLLGFTLRLLLSSRFKHLSLSAGKSVVTSRLIKQAFLWPFPSTYEMEGGLPFLDLNTTLFLAVKQTG